MSKEETEPYYKKRGQELIDFLVDRGFIRDDVSREETRILEDYIGFLFQSTAQSAERTALLMRKYKEKS
jgi:hypothetical protein